MLRKLLLIFACAALAVAAGDTYRVTLFQPSIVSGTELKPGDYKLELNGDKVLIKQGKNTVEAQVKVENGNEKFSATSIRYAAESGKYKVQEIRLGGTTTKLVFN
jgi:hypothetical protein